MPVLFDEFLLGTTQSNAVSSRKFYKDSFSAVQAAQSNEITSTVPHDIQQYLMQKFKNELNYLLQFERCCYCDSEYQRIMNVGSHQCRYHPYSIFGQPSECCGKPYGSIGCVPCDHRATSSPEAARWNSQNQYTAIPQFLINLFNIAPPSIVKTVQSTETPAKNYVLVSRVGQLELRPRCSTPWIIY